jgi:4-amino-4-deoxy-L-arabinose transferase-like glycosyltransferase
VSRRESLVLVAAFAAVGVSLALVLGTSTGAELKEILRWLTPRSLELTFLLLLAGIASSFREIRDSLPERSFFPVLAVGLLALVLVRTIPPQTHRIYYDEDIYENVAQNMVWMGRAQMCNEGTIEAGVFRCDANEYNKEPNGFPFLISLAFRLAGVGEGAAHAVNHLVFAVGAMAVYWLAWLLFGSSAAGYLAALVYALIPQNLLWAATVAAEPSASAMAALGVSAWILFCRCLSWSTALFAASAIAFACQFRPESGLILVVTALITFLIARLHLRRRELWAAALLTFALLTPQLVHTWAVRNENWGSGEESKFSLRAARANAKTNLAYLVEGRDFPSLYTLFAALGLFYPGRRRESLVLLVWFSLLFGIFLPFYAGSYRYGADVRFAFVSSAPLSALAGGGLAWIASWLRRRLAAPRVLAAAPYVLVICAFSPYLPFTRAIGPESWGSRADHASAVRASAELPEESIVLTHNPGMLLVLGRSAVQTSVATYQPTRIGDFFRRFPGGVYFHYSFWCNVPDPVQNEFCTKVLATYPTRVLFEESAGFNRYILYRLLPPSAPPSP